MAPDPIQTAVRVRPGSFPDGRTSSYADSEYVANTGDTTTRGTTDMNSAKT
jgi:hypothetical protein